MTPIIITGTRPYLSAAMPHGTDVRNRPNINADPEQEKTCAETHSIRISTDEYKLPAKPGAACTELL